MVRSGRRGRLAVAGGCLLVAGFAAGRTSGALPTPGARWPGRGAGSSPGPGTGRRRGRRPTSTRGTWPAPSPTSRAFPGNWAISSSGSAAVPTARPPAPRARSRRRLEAPRVDPSSLPCTVCSGARPVTTAGDIGRPRAASLHGPGPRRAPRVARRGILRPAPCRQGATVVKLRVVTPGLVASTIASSRSPSPLTFIARVVGP